MLQVKPEDNLDPEALDKQKQGYVDILKLASDLNQVGVGYTVALSKASENLFQMDKNMSSLVRSMGVTSQYSQLMKQELGRAVTEVTLMGGSQEKINALQKEFIEATNRTIVLSTENIENLFAVSQVSGVAVKALETGFRNAGMETTHISEEMKTVYHTANSLGVNAQVVSTMVVSNLDKMNRFGFGTGVEGMAKMAAKAASMRIDMNQTLGLAEKLFSPEAAIDIAASLQRLGATSSALLDPLKLMDLAQNNVPELQNQLAELSKTFTKFDEKTGKFEIMPQARGQLKEVADALGIDRAEFEKMAIESAKMEKKMSQIDFSGLKLPVDEEQKMMIANLSELNKGTGEYTVKFTDKEGKTVEKALSTLQEGDLKLIEAQQQTLDPQKELVDIAKQQLGAANTLIAQQASYNATVQTQFAITKEGTKFLEAAVTSQAEILKFGMDNNTLDKTKQTGTFGKEIFEGSAQALRGELTKEQVADLAKKMADSLVDSVTKYTLETAKLAAENPSRVAIGLVATNISTLDETLKGFKVDVVAFKDMIIKQGLTIAQVLPLINLLPGLESINLPSPVTSSSTPLEISGQPSPVPAQTTTTTTNVDDSSQVKKIEHKIELTVKAETNNMELNTAITKALSNDDTLRTLRTEIAKVASDYGLTTV